MTHLATWFPVAGAAAAALACCAWLNAADEPGPKADAGADEVLQKVRSALGWDRLAGLPGVLVEGKASYCGADGRFRLLYTPAGEFLRRIDGPLGEQVGCDGKLTWARDWTGMPRRLELAELEAAQVAVAVQTGRWLAPDGPIAVEPLDRPAEGGRLAVRVRPKSGVLAGEVMIDRATWLPVLLKWPGPLGEETWELGDYKAALGGKLPHRVTHTRGGLKDTYEVRTVAAVKPDGATYFKAPTTRPDDTRFDASVAPAVEVKRVPTGHLFARPRVNGQDVGWFALDTGSGAGMSIAPAAAAKLKMPAVGRVVRGGAGKPGEAAVRRGETFRLGPVTITGSYYIELPVEFIDLMKRLYGLDVAGTCGYDLFSRAVVELDLQDPGLRLWEPDGYKLAGAHWQGLVLHQRIPCVRCSFEGREGLFRFDTGAGQTLLFHAPAVVRLGLLEGRQTVATPIGGVGGTVDARAGKLTGFRPAGGRAVDVTAFFVTGKVGALTDPYTVGTFGAGLLGPARVVFDYARLRVAVVDPK
jgi:hypothetical protein